MLIICLLNFPRGKTGPGLSLKRLVSCLVRVKRTCCIMVICGFEKIVKWLELSGSDLDLFA